MKTKKMIKKHTIEFAQIAIMCARMVSVILSIGSMFTLYAAIRDGYVLGIISEVLLIVLMVWLYWSMGRVKVVIDYAERAFDE